MTTVPRASDSVALLPSLLRGWHSGNLTDDFVAWNDWEAVAEGAHADC